LAHFAFITECPKGANLLKRFRKFAGTKKSIAGAAIAYSADCKTSKFSQPHPSCIWSNRSSASIRFPLAPFNDHKTERQYPLTKRPLSTHRAPNASQTQSATWNGAGIQAAPLFIATFPMKPLAWLTWTVMTMMIGNRVGSGNFRQGALGLPGNGADPWLIQGFA